MKNENGNIIVFKIRSNVIRKKVFSLLDLNHKLNLLTYNKKLQNNLLIDIKDYKTTSNKYQTIENTTGKIKQYIIDTNILLNKFEYRTEKNKQIRIEYDNDGNLKFEGEYKNNEIISGKGYDIRGNVILKIEEGKGKEYYNNGKLKFDGAYLNGKKRKITK